MSSRAEAIVNGATPSNAVATTTSGGGISEMLSGFMQSGSLLWIAVVGGVAFGIYKLIKYFFPDQAEAQDDAEQCERPQPNHRKSRKQNKPQQQRQRRQTQKEQYEEEELGEESGEEEIDMGYGYEGSDDMEAPSAPREPSKAQASLTRGFDKD